RIVQLGPGVVRLLRGQQLVIAQHRDSCCLVKGTERGRVAGAVDDERLDRGQLAGDPGQQRDQGVVHDDDPVPGVVDDLGHLGAGQPDVERVQYRTHAGHPEVGLEVLLVVPAERPDRVVRPDPEPGQRPLGVAGPAGAGPGPRHALAAWVHPGTVLHDRADRELVVLHRATDHQVLILAGSRIYRAVR